MLQLPAVVGEGAGLRQLRTRVRGFLEQWRTEHGEFAGIDTWLTAWDPEFTKALAEQGWLGMTIPIEYGGRGATFMDRFVVTEELLAAGAPVSAHWIADRQIVPSLLAFGSPEQRQHFLPRIAAGTCWFGIGMSEPDSGSDLASVRSHAVAVDGGWRVNGSKVWTSGAHLAEAFFALVRTAPRDDAHRHAGLTQLIIDLSSPGVEVRPIQSMSGGHHFNEVLFTDVFVPDDRVLGRVGDGWRQVTSELAYERSGPERFLSTQGLLEAMVANADLFDAAGLGRTIATVYGLHQMSTAIAHELQAGEKPNAAAAVVKILGTTLEGDVADMADLQLRELGADVDTSLHTALVDSVMQRPGFTLRGGTTEVLRGILARELGLR